MQAYVYKSSRKQDTYVYLAARDDFARVPQAILLTLGTLQFVLEVELTPERKLARADPAVVRGNLALRGFHLQIPPSGDHDPMTSDHGTDA
ncbi:MAG: YcgL domain-containing protein [Pseudomonadota bacterium]|nr:YcgL domain-containing protein [Pseudomonadota bacterium]